MARIYSNENFPLPAVLMLRKFGHDVLTIQETGKSLVALSDRELLAFACSQKRAVLTFNRKHFIALHHETVNHEGIIVCSFDADFNSLASRIHEQIKTEHNLAGKLIRINRPAS